MHHLHGHGPGRWWQGGTTSGRHWLEQAKGEGAVSAKASTGSRRRELTGLPLATALLACGAYLAFVVVMIAVRDSSETTWSRLIFLFGSLQALAFAAAGALWGTSVQQERVAAAEKKADESAGDASNGRALAAVIKADARSVVDQPEVTYRGGSPGTPGAGNDVGAVRRHADIASELFPD